MKFEYNTIGKSVRGASHMLNNLPNQDSIIIYEKEIEYSDFTYSIISDGHGSKKCFRSDRGSKFATQVLKNIFDELIRKFRETEELNLSYINRYFEDKLATEIVTNWRKKVDDNIKLYPLVDKEIDLLVSKSDDLSKRDEILKKNRLVAYGATLLGVFATPKYILYVQLGDGDIVIVDKNNDVTPRFPEDERLIGNETTSLCLNKAWNDFRIAFDVIDNEPPKAILLATDGLSNSYSNDQDFFSFVSDSYKLSKEKDVKYINDNLRDWLQEITNDASGDDISVGFIFSKINETELETNTINSGSENNSERQSTDEEIKESEKKTSNNMKLKNKLLLLFSILALITSIISLAVTLYNASMIHDAKRQDFKPQKEVIDSLNSKTHDSITTDTINKKNKL